MPDETAAVSAQVLCTQYKLLTARSNRLTKQGYKNKANLQTENATNSKVFRMENCLVTIIIIYSHLRGGLMLSVGFVWQPYSGPSGTP